MKILISVDIEGISGVVAPSEADSSNRTPQYLETRRWITDDTNAAIEGALLGGANEIIVTDTHGLEKLNIIYEELHPAASLVRGGPNLLLPHDFLTGIDRDTDGILLVGWHDKLGGNGVLSHTYTAKDFDEIRVNGKPFGELDFAVRLAATFNVPLLMLSGDDIICEYARKEYGLITAEVKKMKSRFAAECLSREKVFSAIRNAAKEAVELCFRKPPVAFPKEKNYTLEVLTHDYTTAQALSRVPGVQYDGAKTIRYCSNDFVNIYNMNLILFFLKEHVAFPNL